ncbi:MAG: hypothetical protein PF480_07770 [Roseovarius sp.]|nr:hypothetical protein [Roseovarius sp.]
MGALAEVKWIKTDPSGAEILKIGGTYRRLFGKSKWELSVKEAIALVERDEWRFFIDVDGQKSLLEVFEDPDGTKKFNSDGPIQTLM